MNPGGSSLPQRGQGVMVVSIKRCAVPTKKQSRAYHGGHSIRQTTRTMCHPTRLHGELRRSYSFTMPQPSAGGFLYSMRQPLDCMQLVHRSAPSALVPCCVCVNCVSEKRADTYLRSFFPADFIYGLRLLPSACMRRFEFPYLIACRPS